MASPPIPSRPNPKPRNSEAGDPFAGVSVATHFRNSKVNIPSDFTRRNSLGGRENSRVEFSDKENETKALPTPKGSKNFMSPTISAVSKINPCPRKRVLSDRNQVSRSLSVVTLEDTKIHHQAKSCVSFLDVIDIIGMDEKNRSERSHDMTVTDFDEDKGIVYSDPRFRISPRPSVPYTSPEFADGEVGPLLPLYDHKKDYLSPRPNLRIEKQLEELFISDRCEKQEETEDVEQLEAETSQVPEQSGFGKYKFLGWFLALVMAYMLVSATFSPLLKESHIPREVTEFAKGNSFDKLTKSSLVYIDELISRLRGRAGPLQFHNLTYILEGYTVFEPTSVEIIEEKTRGENNLEEESRGEENSEVIGETNDGETEMKPGTDIELNEGEGNLKVNNDAGGLESQEKLETGSTRNDQEEEEAIYMNQHDVDAESGSEDNLTEIAAETSDGLHPKAMIVSSSTVLVLLAAVAFLFPKKAKHVAVSAPETEAAEVDDNKDPKEHQSGGGNGKLRRESMAASEYSVGSFSFGSFTTYEKIPIKSGDREEKMVTPVRRSSRIRNHHQPPSML